MRVIINIDVPDLTAGVDFYSKALGLQLSRIIEGDVAELVCASSTIYLLQNAEHSAAAAKHAVQRHYGRHWTPVHMDFVVDDIEAATQRALAAGAIRESESIIWQGSKCVTFSDPFGHGFCIIEFESDTYA